MQNSTEAAMQVERLTAKLGVKATLLVLYIAVGTYGNGCTLYTIWNNQRLMYTALNSLIAILSLCDFIICGFMMPFILGSLVHGRWMFGNVFCKIHYVFMMYLGKVTVLCIAAIVVERYLSICRRRYPSLSNKSTICVILGIVLVPIPFSLLQYRQSIAYLRAFGVCSNTYQLRQEENTIAFIIEVIFLRCIPILIDLFSFWKIFIVLRRLKKRVSPGLLSNEDKLTASAYAHSASTSVTFVLTYLGLGLPLYIVMLIQRKSVLSGKSGLSDEVRVAAIWLYWLGCVVKPIIYILHRRPRFMSYLRHRFPELRHFRLPIRVRRVKPREIGDGTRSLQGVVRPIQKFAFGEFTDQCTNSTTTSRPLQRPEILDSDVSLAAEIKSPTVEEGHRLTAALFARMHKIVDNDSEACSSGLESK